MDLAEHMYKVSARAAAARDYGFVNQVHKAALSIPSNIAEGFERGTRSEFHHFLSIAKASCAEVRTQIYFAKRVGYIDASTQATMLSEAESVARLIGKLRAIVGQQRGTPPMPHAPYPMPDEGQPCS